MNVADPVAPRPGAVARFAPTRYRAESPSSGETFEFVTSSRSTPDGRFRFVWTLAPGKRGPGEHTHDDETETFEVVSGTLRLWVSGTPRDLGPGDVCAVPPGVPHKFLNPGQEPAVVNVTLDGPKMEDALVPLAVVCDGRTPRLSDLSRLLVGLAQYPSRPTNRLVTAGLLTVIGLFKLFGVRRYEPVLGWDRDAAP